MGGGAQLILENLPWSYLELMEKLSASFSCWYITWLHQLPLNSILLSCISRLFRDRYSPLDRLAFRSPSYHILSQWLFPDLVQLATLTLCPRWHLFDRPGVCSQADTVARRWLRIIRHQANGANLERPLLYYGLSHTFGQSLNSNPYNLDSSS